MSIIVPVSADTQTELAALNSFLNDLFNASTLSEGKLSSSLKELRLQVQDSLRGYEPSEPEEEKVATNGYTVFAIENTHNTRTYRLEVHLDNDFTDAAETKIRAALDIMLDRMVAGQLQSFIERAETTRYGLRNRRRKSLPFPHPLPYVNPSPSTIEAQVVEEAAIIEATVFGVLHSVTNTEHCKLKLNAYSSSKSGVFGKAPVNSYNRQRALYISLNTHEFSRRNHSNEIWAGVIAHELLHNLGWEHPDSQYTLAMPIEIYQACISGGHHLDESFIR